MAKSSQPGCCTFFQRIGSFLRRILPKKKNNRISPLHSSTEHIENTPDYHVENVALEKKKESSADGHTENGLDGFLDDFVSEEISRIRSMFVVQDTGDISDDQSKENDAADDKD